MAAAGHATVQAPQPWHKASFTTATVRVSFIPAKLITVFSRTGDSAVRTNFFTSQTATANLFCAVSHARIRHELILGQKADGFHCCRTCLGNGFRNILSDPWHIPAKKMPAVGLSTGLSLGCASVKKSSLSMLVVSMVASFRTSLLGLIAVAKTTKSASIIMMFATE
jgi:hypothetical protein